jgi:hypothetical protein
VFELELGARPVKRRKTFTIVVWEMNSTQFNGVCKGTIELEISLNSRNILLGEILGLHRTRRECDCLLVPMLSLSWCDVDESTSTGTK